jgi:hypothetical protein
MPVLIRASRSRLAIIDRCGTSLGRRPARPSAWLVTWTCRGEFGRPPGRAFAAGEKTAEAGGRRPDVVVHSGDFHLESSIDCPAR